MHLNYKINLILSITFEFNGRLYCCVGGKNIPDQGNLYHRKPMGQLGKENGSLLDFHWWAKRKPFSRYLCYLTVNVTYVSFNPFCAGTAFMLMQTGWIQASRRVTLWLAWDPTCLPLSPSFPIKNKQNLKV